MSMLKRRQLRLKLFVVRHQQALGLLLEILLQNAALQDLVCAVHMALLVSGGYRQLSWFAGW